MPVNTCGQLANASALTAPLVMSAVDVKATGAGEQESSSHIPSQLRPLPPLVVKSAV
jgi:hypothetical protein